MGHLYNYHTDNNMVDPRTHDKMEDNVYYLYLLCRLKQEYVLNRNTNWT